MLSALLYESRPAIHRTRFFESLYPHAHPVCVRPERQGFHTSDWYRGHRSGVGPDWSHCNHDLLFSRYRHTEAWRRVLHQFSESNLRLLRQAILARMSGTSSLVASPSMSSCKIQPCFCTNTDMLDSLAKSNYYR